MLFWIENTTTNNNEKLKKQVAVEDGYRLKKEKRGIGFFCRANGELVFLGQLFSAIKEVLFTLNPREKMSFFWKDCTEEESR